MTYAMTPEEFLETIRLVFDCHNVFDRETIPGTFGILSDLIKKRDEAIRQAEREKYLEWQKDSALTLAAQAPAVKPTELEPNQRSKPTELEDVVLKVVMARAHTEDYPCTYEQLEQNAKWWIKVILEAARQHLAAQTPAVNSPIIQSTAAYDGTHEVFTNQTPQGDGWLPIESAPDEPEEKPHNVSLENWTGKIHCMDCIKLMQQLPRESVGVIVTSPPYNLKNSTGNGMKDGRGGKWANASLINGYADHEDSMPHDEYVDWQRKCLTEMMRVLRPDGAIFYNHKWRVQDGLLQDRNDIVSGFPVRQIIIWKRKGGINFNAGYFLPTYEVIYLIAKPAFKLAPKANAMGDVWEIPQARDNEHPAPFPVELAQRCITATNDGVVLDPFMGSGTTALASEILNREWIGAELSKQYCKMAEIAIAKLTRQAGRGSDDRGPVR